ncbi:phosphate ABC transporter substrate-binding protein PstS [Mesorhizobium helmanticense]|uniref:Phosphate-binding protein PstS n=1 Tax=Mesorhizobium helmanticense TaxID=1776423 RepID=A0A2T4ISW8_9HYPH|nr:phosphate ABC transporter substrate-binding protein PstS [Mesorhizobium helmanticense]PTE08741.1 phosphate ABC transporter substrate-binding protein PstS [Mesorhizobium helmanticense]
MFSGNPTSIASSHSLWPKLVGGVIALAVALAAALTGPAARAEPIRGAGSTLAAPVIAKWATAYKNARADGGDFFTLDWTVDYEPVGSLAGLMRLKQPELDFAATDVPVPPANLASSGQKQFPIVMGGIAVVTNLEGLPEGGLRLSGPVLADIYLGKITSWSDPAIQALNPGIALGDLAISVFHRQDGSGSTHVFTEFLSVSSEEWKTRLGADTLIEWPLGTGAEGTQALIGAVAATKGAIAYAEYGQVLRAGLPFAAVRNRAGNFIKPDPAGVQAAATSVAWGETTDFFASLTDRDGDAAYPISTAVFAVVQVSGRSEHRYRRVHDLFRLAFTQGAGDAAALGYVPLPSALVGQIEQYWSGQAPLAN